MEENNTNNEANRDRMLFIRIEEETPWSKTEMDDAVKAIDAVTPEDVGVMLSSSEIEYLDSEQVEEYIDELREKCE